MTFLSFPCSATWFYALMTPPGTLLGLWVGSEVVLRTQFARQSKELMEREKEMFSHVAASDYKRQRKKE